jgi:hypothetical protein
MQCTVASASFSIGVYFSDTCAYTSRIYISGVVQYPSNLVWCLSACVVAAGVVKLRRGLTARVFDECDGMGELYGWFTQFLQTLQEKALLQVDKTDPTREVRWQQQQQLLLQQLLLQQLQNGDGWLLHFLIVDWHCVHGLPNTACSHLHDRSVKLYPLIIDQQGLRLPSLYELPGLLVLMVGLGFVWA